MTPLCDCSIRKIQLFIFFVKAVDVNVCLPVDCLRGANMPLTRRCSRCKKEKPISAFGPKMPSGQLRAYCRVCERIRQRVWRSANSSRFKANQRAWSKRNPDRNLKSQIGITAEIKYERLKSQGGVCGACRAPQHHSRRALGLSGWCADHDHKTKKFRGVLCNNCNLALGYAKDSPEILMALIKYLESYR